MGAWTIGSSTPSSSVTRLTMRGDMGRIVPPTVSAMSEERVTINIDGGVADVRMNRPEKMNALDGAQFAAIVDAGESLKKEPGVRAVVLSGNGRAFCAGLDFGSFQQMAG